MVHLHRHLLSRLTLPHNLLCLQASHLPHAVAPLDFKFTQGVAVFGGAGGGALGLGGALQVKEKLLDTAVGLQGGDAGDVFAVWVGDGGVSW